MTQIAPVEWDADEGVTSIAVLPRCAPPLPALSGALTYRTRRILEAGPVEAGGATPSEVREAQSALPVMEAMCVPGPPELIFRWMEMVALAVRNAPKQPLRGVKVSLIVETSGDLPGAVWTEESRAAFSRRGGEAAEQWPADGAVDGFLRPRGRVLTGLAHALAAVVAWGERQAARRALVVDEPVLTHDERVAAADAIMRKHGYGSLPPARGPFPSQEPPMVARDGATTVRPRLSVTLKGEALWLSRNRGRREMGLPLFDKPSSWEGYGS